MIRTAILVDGGFYRKRARTIKGNLSREERAKELFKYCMSHINSNVNAHEEKQSLYRIFYYDCKPLENRSVFHPLSRKNINLGKQESYAWTISMLNELRKTRKVALRLGELSSTSNYNLKASVTKDLFLNKIRMEDITENKKSSYRYRNDIASPNYKITEINQIKYGVIHAENLDCFTLFFNCQCI